MTGQLREGRDAGTGRRKLHVGIVGLTSDAGCQLEFLNFEEDFLAIIAAVDIVHFPMVRTFNVEGPFDIAFVDGVPARPREVETLRRVRASSTVLAALGSCASFGGVPAAQHFQDLSDLKKYVYKGMEDIDTLEIFPIANYVKVDLQLRGCPASQWEIMETLSAMIAGRVPQLKSYPQ